MCKAVQDMNNKAKQEGRQEGKLETLCVMIRKGMLFYYLILFIVNTSGQADHGVYEVFKRH